jgi:hypothetical protein
MAKTYTANFKRRVGGTSGSEPSYLLEITHPQLVAPIRVINDNDKLRRVTPGPLLNLPGFAADGATIALDFDFTKATGVPQVGAGFGALTCARAGSTATRVNALGLIEIVAADTLRFDFDPVTLACKGLLTEEVRTNVFTRTADLSHADWIKLLGATVTPDTGIAPDGTTSADTINFSATASNRVEQSPVAAVDGETWTVSYWLSGSGTININVGTSSGIGGQTELTIPLTSTLTRYTATVTLAAPTGNVRGMIICRIPGNTATSCKAWGAQLEKGAFATSYIPTTSAAVTRNADVSNVATLGPLFSVSEGTLVSEFDLLATINTANQYVAAFRNAASTNVIGYRTSSGPLGRSSGLVVSGGVTQADFNAGTATVGPVNRDAFAYKLNDFAESFGGAAAVTDLAGIVPAVDRLDVGHLSGTQQLNGHIRRLTCLPQRLQNADLVQLSSAPFTTYTEEYLACAFHIQFPDDVSGSMPRVPISIDNIGRELTQWLETSQGGRDASVRIMQVMRDTPDVIEQECTLFLLNTNQSMTTISGQLGYENVLDQPALGAIQTPQLQPGIF